MVDNSISLCMIVKNEAAHLQSCLNSVKDIVTEMIVVDTGSTDHTVQIAKGYGANVISVPWQSDFAKARNAGISLAKGTWILILDADEQLDEAGKQELAVCSGHPEFAGFFLQIYNHSGSTPESPVSTINPVLRMFRNDPRHRFRGKIHEQIASSIVEHNPNAALHITNVVIHHYGYEQQLVIKRDKIRRNLDLLMQTIQEEPEDPFHHYNIAVEHMRLNDHHSAMPYLEKALLLLTPEVSYTHLLYKYTARCLYALGRYQEAVQACDSGIRLYPDYTDLYHVKGVIQLACGFKEEAKKAHLQAVQTGPAPAHYHTEAGIGTFLSAYCLGQAYEETGDDNRAVHWYSEAIKHNSRMTKPFQKIFRIMKCTGLEANIPELLHNRLDLTSPETLIRIIDLLMTDACYRAALVLLNSLTGADYSHTKDQKTELCRLLSGNVLRKPVLPESKPPSPVPGRENKNIYYWIGQKEPAQEGESGAFYIADGKPEDGGVTGLDIKIACYKGETEKALRFLKSRQPVYSTDARTVYEDGYAGSRLWTALADAKLGLPDKHSLHYWLFRYAKQNLPFFRGRQGE